MPSEEATEIAGSAEDAALEAAQEAIEDGGEKPVEPASVAPVGEGHAVPSDDAQEIAGAAEDVGAADDHAAALEARRHLGVGNAGAAGVLDEAVIGRPGVRIGLVIVHRAAGQRRAGKSGGETASQQGDDVSAHIG